MDAATSKQKAYVRDLFVKCGVPRWVFNPLKLWNISRDDADMLIGGLKIMKKFEPGDLKDVIWEGLQSKNMVQIRAKTIDELEEEQADYDPTVEDWLDQQVYEDDVQSNEWIRNLHQDVFRKKDSVNQQRPLPLQGDK